MNKKVMASTQKSQWGMALPMALVLLVLASLVIVPGVYVVGSMLKISSKVSQNTLAYYAADAGVADLMWRYKYGTAPTISYPLTGINNMDVQVSPVGTSGQGYWVVSAPVTASKAQIYVQVQQTGSQSGGIFNYAVASLNGNITLNGNNKDLKPAGKVVVVADNTCVVDYCDSATASWTPSTGVTATLNRDASYRQLNVCYDLGGSATMAMTSNKTGNLAWKLTDTDLNNFSYNYIWAWIRNNVQLNANRFTFRINSTPGFPGTTMDNFTCTYDILKPTGGWVKFSRTGAINVSLVKSIGICSDQVLLSGTTIYVDNVIANNDASPPANPSVRADMYANGDGDITIKQYVRVGGTASATGTVPLPPTTAYVQNTASGVTPLANPFTTAYVQNYIDQGDAGTDYTSSAGSWNSGTGTITIGPGYIDGDVTLGGSKNFVLTGTIHVRESGKKKGKLTIKDTATIQGNYTIVSDGDLTINGPSTATTMLAADNIPTLLCQGAATVTDRGISANIYVPTAAVTITTGGSTIPVDFNVYGSVIAKSVTMNNYATVRYPIPVGRPELVAYDYR